MYITIKVFKQKDVLVRLVRFNNVYQVEVAVQYHLPDEQTHLTEFHSIADAEAFYTSEVSIMLGGGNK